MHDLHELLLNNFDKETKTRMAKKKTAKTIPSTLKKLRDVQLDIPAVDFTDAAEFKAAYDTADQAVKQAAEASVDRQAEVIAALAKMRSLLSQRGSDKIRKEAGITQGWGQYFRWFQRTYNFQLCLRAVLNKIDVLNGKKLCPSCNKTNGHTPSCPKYKKPAPQLSLKECRLLAGLSAGNDLVKAIKQGGDVDAAISEYRKAAPTPERLEEWVEQRVIPYQPESGDLLVVHGQQFTLVEVRDVSEYGDDYLLTLAVAPVRLSKDVPATATKDFENAVAEGTFRKPAATTGVAAKKAAQETAVA